METKVWIEAVDPDRIWRGQNRDIHFTRFDWPDEWNGDIVIQPANMDVVQSLNVAVKQSLDTLYSIVGNKNNQASLRRRVRGKASVPLPGLFQLFRGRPQPIVRIEVKLDDPGSIRASDDGLMVTLGATDDSHCLLALRNIPAAQRIVEILDEQLEQYLSSPYGPNSEYSKKSREKEEEIRTFIATLRDGIVARTGDSEIAGWSNPEFVQFVRGAAEWGDPPYKMAILELVEAEIGKLKYPPKWATEIMERKRRPDRQAKHD